MYNNYSGLFASCSPIFGSAYSSGAHAGCFFLNVYVYSSANLGGRLIYL